MAEDVRRYRRRSVILEAVQVSQLNQKALEKFTGEKLDAVKLDDGELVIYSRRHSIEAYIPGHYLVKHKGGKIEQMPENEFLQDFEEL